MPRCSNVTGRDELSRVKTCGGERGRWGCLVRRRGRRGPRGAMVDGIRVGALQREPETECARHAPCSHPREPASRHPPRRRGTRGAQPAGAAWWTASCGEL